MTQMRKVTQLYYVITHYDDGTIFQSNRVFQDIPGALQHAKDIEKEFYKHEGTMAIKRIEVVPLHHICGFTGCSELGHVEPRCKNHMEEA